MVFQNVPCYDNEDDDDLPASAFRNHAPIMLGAIALPEVSTTTCSLTMSAATTSREPSTTTTSTTTTFQTAATSSSVISNSLTTCSTTSNTSVTTTTLSSTVGAQQQELQTDTATEATAKKSKDEEIYEKIDLKKTESINKFFKFQPNKGKLKPIPSVLGCSSNYKIVFRQIREWRKFTQSQQEQKKAQYTKDTTEQQK